MCDRCRVVEKKALVIDGREYEVQIVSAAPAATPATDTVAERMAESADVWSVLENLVRDARQYKHEGAN